MVRRVNLRVLPPPVGRSRLLTANASIAALESTALIIGPPLGGALASIVDPSTAMLADAAS